MSLSTKRLLFSFIFAVIGLFAADYVLIDAKTPNQIVWPWFFIAGLLALWFFEGVRRVYLCGMSSPLERFAGTILAPAIVAFFWGQLIFLVVTAPRNTSLPAAHLAIGAILFPLYVAAVSGWLLVVFVPSVVRLVHRAVRRLHQWVAVGT